MLSWLHLIYDNQNISLRRLQLEFSWRRSTMQSMQSPRGSCQIVSSRVFSIGESQWDPPLQKAGFPLEWTVGQFSFASNVPTWSIFPPQVEKGRNRVDSDDGQFFHATAIQVSSVKCIEMTGNILRVDLFVHAIPYLN